MKMLLIGIMGIAVVFSAIADPELTGTPDELTAHLRAIPGQVTLTGTAEIKVEADRAEIVIKVKSSDRLFKNALVQNQQMRAEIMAALEKSGIPAERIRMSRFSSVPTQGFFTSKVKAYDIESRVTIEATSEKEIQAVAAVVDEKEGLSLQSLTFSSTQKDKQTEIVLHQAIAKVRGLKAIYEKELGVTLIPRSLDAPSAVRPMDLVRRRLSADKDVSGLSSEPPSSEFGLTLSALRQSEPDISQFDQVVYTATVKVTFDVIKEEKR